MTVGVPGMQSKMCHLGIFWGLFWAIVTWKAANVGSGFLQNLLTCLKTHVPKWIQLSKIPSPPVPSDNGEKKKKKECALLKDSLKMN